MEIYPGTVHLPGFLSLADQKALVKRCEAIGGAPAGFYTPKVRGEAYMRIKMVCLGKHWNAKTYKYEPTRSDYDGLPVQEIPEDLKQLARRAALAAGMQIDPDICLLNSYREGGRLGLHQDKDERAETIEAGIPVVSISLGDTAAFLIGGTRRKDGVKTVLLESGDALVFGGPSRLRFHGVSGLVSGSAPEALVVKGRFRVFVSSSFRDMQEERDELVKRVFPRLQKVCKKRGIAWSEVDLRWGITDEQKADGKVLPICLAEIERCRPYFIGLLGERYGWVPEEIPQALVEQEPWLAEHRTRSVTEIEILHGVLRNPQMAQQSFFYFRDSSFAESVPPDQLQDYLELPNEGDVANLDMPRPCSVLRKERRSWRD